MAKIDDIAAYFVSRLKSVSAMKLHKLVYYAQAWHLAWEEVPLFDSRIEAWPTGPVVPELYHKHRGRYMISDWPDGDYMQVSPSEKVTLNAVLRTYGHLDGRKLTYLAHQEDPWLNARGDLAPTETSNAEILPSAMLEYFQSLDTSPEAVPVDEVSWRDWEAAAS